MSLPNMKLGGLKSSDGVGKKSTEKPIDIRFRHTMRGLKRCPSCGEINGQRALLCRNRACELRRKPFDPVQLVTHTGAALFSLRCKDRDSQPRNFVQITEITLTLEPNSAIVSRNAICFVDTCKYDACDAADISCKHIKACCVSQESSSLSMPKAEVYSVAREVLFNLNISAQQKQLIWEMYKQDELDIPAVQRLNTTTFAVKCAPSKVFPAGRLHVTAINNAVAAKNGTHACSCKKLKIIVEPDNSVVMQEEICDHLLLVLAAILSQPNGKSVYGNFASALKSFWMPASLEIPLCDAASQEDAFFGLSINIGGNFGEGNTDHQTAADDIFIFGDEFLADDNIPDFSDVILDITPTADSTPTICTTTISGSTMPDLLHAGDPNLVSSCNINEDLDNDIHFHNAATTIATAPDTTTIDTVTGTHLELSDCNIELMDEFQLTDQIDLCSDDITLPTSVSTTPIGADLFESNSVSILTPSLQNSLPLPRTVNIPATVTHKNPPAATYYNTTSLLKSNRLDLGTLLPPIEMPTIAVVKKCPVRSAQIVAAVKTRKFPHIPAKRALIVNSSHSPEYKLSVEQVDAASEPTLAYSAWLEHVIETINESIEIVEQTHVKHNFHVHEEMFAHFSKSFSVGGIKRRLPNSTTVVKSGKHKGLIKYSWYFPTSSTVQRIFNTKNISIEVERAFECQEDGNYVRWQQECKTSDYIKQNHDKKLKRIYPKLALYVAHVRFECGNDNHKSGFKLDWLPNAFPRSHFGILTIEFSLAIKDPHKL